MVRIRRGQCRAAPWQANGRSLWQPGGGARAHRRIGSTGHCLTGLVVQDPDVGVWPRPTSQHDGWQVFIAAVHMLAPDKSANFERPRFLSLGLLRLSGRLCLSGSPAFVFVDVVRNSRSHSRVRVRTGRLGRARRPGEAPGARARSSAVDNLDLVQCVRLASRPVGHERAWSSASGSRGSAWRPCPSCPAARGRTSTNHHDARTGTSMTGLAELVLGEAVPHGDGHPGSNSRPARPSPPNWPMRCSAIRGERPASTAPARPRRAPPLRAPGSDPRGTRRR